MFCAFCKSPSAVLFHYEWNIIIPTAKYPALINQTYFVFQVTKDTYWINCCHTYCNLFIPLFFQPHLVMPCVWRDIPSSMVLTPLWSVGNCVTYFLCDILYFATWRTWGHLCLTRLCFHHLFAVCLSFFFMSWSSSQTNWTEQNHSKNYKTSHVQQFKTIFFRYEHKKACHLIVIEHVRNIVATLDFRDFFSFFCTGMVLTNNKINCNGQVTQPVQAWPAYKQQPVWIWVCWAWRKIKIVACASCLH